MHARARIAGRIERDAERLADRRAHVVGEGHLGAIREVCGEHAEPFVRVDPAPSRARDRLLSLERQTGGVREQVPHGRAGRACRLVEVDDSLLGGDEKGKGGDGLRDGGKANGMARVSAGLDPRRRR